MEKFYEDIQSLKSRVLQQLKDEGLAKLESAISYPIPFVWDHRILFRFIIYTSVAKADHQLIYYPYGLVTYNIFSNKIESKKGFLEDAKTTQTEKFPNDEIKKLSKIEYEVMQNEFVALYLEVMTAFFSKELSGTGTYDNDQKQKFLEMFELLTPNILKQWHYDFGADFFSWLKKED